jgi:hypothetical protein
MEQKQIDEILALYDLKVSFFDKEGDTEDVNVWIGSLGEMLKKPFLWSFDPITIGGVRLKLQLKR